MTVGSLILAMSPVVDAKAAETQTVHVSKVQGISGQCGGLFGGNATEIHVPDTVTTSNNGTVAVRPTGDRARKNGCSAPAKPLNTAPLPGKPR